MNGGNSYYLAVSGLLAMAAAMGIGRFVYTPILPDMMAAVGWSALAAGLVASANYLGYLAGALATAFGSIAGDLRRWLLAALLVSAVTTIGMAVQNSAAVAGLVRFIGGFASAIVIVSASTLILQRLQTRGHGHLASLHFAGVGVGIAASSVVVAGLVAAGFDWRTQWLVTGLIALLAVPVVASGVKPERTDRAASATPRAATTAPALRLLIAAYGLFGFGYVITATFLVAIVREDPTLGALEPWIWLIVGLAAVPSVGLWSRFGNRIGALPAFALASLLLAFGVAASVEWRSFTGAVIAAAILGGTFMGMTALGLIGARLMAGGSAQRVIGQMTASFALGQMIGPALTGVLAERFGSFRLPSLLAAAALAIAAALALRAWQKAPRGRRSRHP